MAMKIFQRLFNWGKLASTKTESKKEKVDLDSLVVRNNLSINEIAEMVSGKIKASWSVCCGRCTEVQAREIMKKYSTQFSDLEYLRLYKVLNGDLHSHYRYIENNFSINEEIDLNCIDAADRVLNSNASRSVKSEVAELKLMVVRALSQDYPLKMNEDFVVNSIDKAKLAIDKGNAINAFLETNIARTALDRIHKDYSSSWQLLNPEIDNLYKVLSSNIVSICSKSDRSSKAIAENLSYGISQDEIKSRLSKSKLKYLNRFLERNFISPGLEEHLITRRDYILNNFKYNLKQISSNKEKNIPKVSDSYSSKISDAREELQRAEWLQKVRPSRGNQAQLELAKKSLDLLCNELNEKIKQSNLTYDSEIAGINAKKNEYEANFNGLFNKFKNRTMTQQEYRSLKKLNYCETKSVVANTALR